MTQMTEITYWLAIAHLPKWKIETINKMIVKVFIDNKLTLEEFFNLEKSVWQNEYQLSEIQVNDLLLAKEQLPNFSFLAEELVSQGFEVIPINSPDYSKILKNNLKLTHSPTVLYIKGNKKILQEESIAIVGSRDADNISLDFADNIAKKASESFKVVVSGFAKGVDKQSLDSALKYKGQSIIVLPQGVLTFGSGIKQYYSHIVEGNVLVLSTFHPKASWSVPLAMARNPIIYGLANEIYVAQSADKGGTWAGVLDGLRKGRKIFVRLPKSNESNANMLLIERGAVPVSQNGTIDINNEITLQLAEKQNEYKSAKQNLIDSLTDLLSREELSCKQIKLKLNLDLEDAKLTKIIKGLPNISVFKSKGRNLFGIKLGNNDLFSV